MGCLDLVLGTKFQDWICTSDEHYHFFTHIDGLVSISVLRSKPPKNVEELHRQIIAAVDFGDLKLARSRDEDEDFPGQRKLRPKDFVKWAVGLEQGFEFDPKVLNWAGLSPVVDAGDDLKIIEGTESLVAATAAASVEDLPPPTHSEDFRSVRWGGESYSFTVSQACVVEHLWRLWEDGILEASQESILERALGRDNGRLRDTFRINKKTNPAWGAMIVSGKKGAFGLSRVHLPPTKKPQQ